MYSAAVCTFRPGFTSQKSTAAANRLCSRLAEAFAGIARLEQQVRAGACIACALGEPAPEFLGTRLARVQAQHVTRDPAELFTARHLASRVAGHALEHLQARRRRTGSQ